MAKKEIIVIGVGRFATELINKLNKTNDFNIVAIDKDPKKLEALEGVKNIIVGDATDREFLLNVGVDNADCYVIGMGQDFQASLVIASIIKENFSGKVFAKSVDPNHENILKALGVEEVITPEVAAAQITYARMINPLADIKGGKKYLMSQIAPGVYVVNVPALKMDQGQLIKDIDMPEGVGIALMIKPKTGAQIVHGDTLIEEGDILSMVGKEAPLRKLLADIQKDKVIEIAEEEESKKDRITKVHDKLKEANNITTQELDLDHV